jgi:hypothetical protein
MTIASLCRARDLLLLKLRTLTGGEKLIAYSVGTDEAGDRGEAVGITRTRLLHASYKDQDGKEYSLKKVKSGVGSGNGGTTVEVGVEGGGMGGRDATVSLTVALHDMQQLSALMTELSKATPPPSPSPSPSQQQHHHHQHQGPPPQFRSEGGRGGFDQPPPPPVEDDDDGPSSGLVMDWRGAARDCYLQLSSIDGFEVCCRLWASSCLGFRV